MSRITLYSCPSLEALILPRQCEANQIRFSNALNPGSDDLTARVMLQCCAMCPGVTALHKGNRGRKRVNLNGALTESIRAPFVPHRKIGRFCGTIRSREVTTTQASMILNVRPGYAKVILGKHKIKGRSIGKRTMYPREAVERIAAERRAS